MVLKALKDISQHFIFRREAPVIAEYIFIRYAFIGHSNLYSIASYKELSIVDIGSDSLNPLEVEEL